MNIQIGSYVRYYFLHEANGFTYKDGIIVDIFKRGITEYKILFYIDESVGLFTLTQIEEEFEVINV
jgi:hypothetical protein